MKWHIWNHVVTKKSFKQIRIYLRFFKVATLCLDDSFAHVLSTSFTWNAFPTVLKEFPHMLSTCWLLFLHSAIKLIPNHLNWVEIGWLWRPGPCSTDAALHHTHSWSNSPYTAWRCVGSLSCWKTNDSPAKRKPDGMAYRCRMWRLETKIIK